MDKMLTRGEFDREYGWIQPWSYRETRMEKYQLGPDGEAIRPVGVIIGGLVGFLLAVKLVWIDKGAGGSDATSRALNSILLTVLYIVLGVIAGLIVLFPLIYLIAHIIWKSKKNKCARECDAYEKQYDQAYEDYVKQYKEKKKRYDKEIEKESRQYANSELVKQAAGKIADLFFKLWSRSETHPTDEKTVNGRICIDVSGDTIEYTVFKAGNSSDLHERDSIRFTGDGWRFEKITNSRTGELVAWATAEAVRTRVLNRAAELSMDKDPNCQISLSPVSYEEEETYARTLIDYSATNNNFMPAQKI